MPKPMHPRAPATPAPQVVAACNPASPLLDDWSSLSPIALPLLAPSSGGDFRRVWSRLLAILIPGSQSARTV